LITLESFETEIAKWEMKFDSVRDWRAERARLPLMRQHYETMLAETGLPPDLQSFADSFWQACIISGVSPNIEAGVKARAKRSLPSFVRETHLNLLLKAVFQDIAKVDNSVETDTQKKTDFLIESVNHPVVFRLHTYTYRLTIDRKTGRTLPNDFWVYSPSQVQEVVDYFRECEDSYRCEATA